MASEIPEGDLHDGARAETVRIFTSHEAADLAAANLQAHGIRCWINADDGGGMLPNLAAPGGVRLLVQASDFAAASALLKNQVSDPETPAQNEAEDEIFSPATTWPRRMSATGHLLVGIVAGVCLCLFFQWYSQLGEKVHYYHSRDGKAVEAWVYRNGHLVEFMKDRNSDGSWDQWSYYENGRIARLEVDNNFDGKPDETWTYSNGNLIKMEKDTDFNGTPDMFCAYKDGLITEADYAPNGAKYVTQRHLYQNGVLVEIQRGGDSSGHFKESVRYDPFFNPISTNQPQ